MNKLVFFNRDKSDSFALETAIENSLACTSKIVQSDIELKRTLEQKVFSLIITLNNN